MGALTTTPTCWTLHPLFHGAPLRLFMGGPCDCGAATGVDGEGAISPPAAPQIDALPVDEAVAGQCGRLSPSRVLTSTKPVFGLISAETLLKMLVKKKQKRDVQQRAAVKETTKHRRP